MAVVSLPKHGSYVWSEDEERFSSDGFESVEAALHDAGDHGAEGAVYVGTVQCYEPQTSVDGEDMGTWLWELLACRAGDNAGEVAEDYPDLGRSEEAALRERCQAFLDVELARPEWTPSFYTVAGVERHEMPEMQP